MEKNELHLYLMASQRPFFLCTLSAIYLSFQDFDEIKEYEFSAAGYQRNEEEYLHLHDIMSSDVYREISRCLGVWTFYIYMEFGFS